MKLTGLIGAVALSCAVFAGTAHAQSIPLNLQTSLLPANGPEQYCLDLDGNNAARGVIQLWACNYAAPQTFLHHADGRLTLSAAPNRCLTIAPVNWLPSVARAVGVADCPTVAIRWRVVDGNMMCTDNNFCLDVRGGRFNSGVRMAAYPLNRASANQKWRITN